MMNKVVLWVSGILGLAATVTAACLGIRQYRQAAKQY